ncbi:MAG: hypothetical protein G3H99_00360 [Ferrovum sp.]|nr:hypothetical protein [Ferrovum sp.]NDU88162.1 hypothetical protein [Ferrovum sp.]
MKILLWFLALFGLAAAFALALNLHSGYILIVTPPWRVEISLPLFLISMILLLLGLHFLGKLFYHLWQIPTRIRTHPLVRTRKSAGTNRRPDNAQTPEGTKGSE